MNAQSRSAGNLTDADGRLRLHVAQPRQYAPLQLEDFSPQVSEGVLHSLKPGLPFRDVDLECGRGHTFTDMPAHLTSGRTQRHRTSDTGGVTANSTISEVVAGLDLRGRVAIVTGGYSGLGLEVSRAMSDAGATVVVPARRLDRAREALVV
jgi:hypothetical protein